eukprot:TRINITY_DN21866_c0_g1_i1.p1 TRINITY_DN21866_c0_g1~~TRINITY_DN21866_c0_g1_i1.p1  ORF type:complete len:949 (-),score=162.74 TRINITY_DN21866_c0_g1_i1:93-2939(-)
MMACSSITLRFLTTKLLIPVIIAAADFTPLDAADSGDPTSTCVLLQVSGTVAPAPEVTQVSQRLLHDRRYAKNIAVERPAQEELLHSNARIETPAPAPPLPKESLIKTRVDSINPAPAHDLSGDFMQPGDEHLAPAPPPVIEILGNEGSRGDGDGEGPGEGEEQEEGDGEGAGHSEPVAAHHDSGHEAGSAHAEGGHAEGGHGGHVPPGAHYSVLFIFLVLAVGCITQSVLERYIPSLPYTCVLFVQGFLISVLQEHRILPWLSIDKAVELWQHVDPHTAFYALLAPLVFADAMTMNFSMMKTCFWQCMLLAGPGVIIGTGIIGTCAKFLMPYKWDWYVSMLFGSVLSATDPVAVVAIFGSLGVSAKLTMLVSGEALFNDGTAVVLFELMLMLVTGSTPSALGIITFFAKKTILGPLLGLAIGNIAVYIIGRTSKGYYHGDSMGQVIITICCAYISFVVAELELTSSGVLAGVVAGVTIAASAWNRFVDKSTIRLVWHTVEFTANTIIFILAGLLFGHVYTRDHINSRDIIFVFVSYTFVMLTRVVMLAMLYPFLQRAGPRVSMGEFAVMGWSGLRGAVGLLMAVIVDHSQSERFREETSSRIMFHVGGIAALTLLVNGTMMPWVLRICGLMTPKNEHERLIEEIKRQINTRVQHQLVEELNHSGKTNSAMPGVSTATLFEGVQARQVSQLVPALQEAQVSSRHNAVKHDRTEQPNDQITRLLREMTLRAVRSIYDGLASEGVLEKSGVAMNALVDSVNEGLLNPDEPLCTFGYITLSLRFKDINTANEHKPPPRTALQRIRSTFDFSARSFARYSEQRVFATLAFIFAHERASEELAQMCKETFAEAIEAQNVQIECRSQIELAKLAKQSLPKEKVAAAKTKMLAAKLLRYQHEVVSDLVRKGVIVDDDGADMDEGITETQRRLDLTPLGSSDTPPSPPQGFASPRR